MAYDALGNYTGYEDSYMPGYDTGPIQYQPIAPQQASPDVGQADEEERRRLEREARLKQEAEAQALLAQAQQSQAQPVEPTQIQPTDVQHEQKVTTYADGTQTVTTKQELPAGAQTGAVTSPQIKTAPIPEAQPMAAPSAPIAPNTSAQGVAAQTGRRFAADQNNPSGLGWNPKTQNWNSFATPAEGVAATSNQVGRYLNSQGPMQGRAPTPENIVSTWVTGGKTPAEEIQKGQYLATVKDQLARSNVQLNPDGSVPNTPEANMAITRAIAMRETLPAHMPKFAEALGLAQPGAPASPTPVQTAQGPAQPANPDAVAPLPLQKLDTTPNMKPNSYDEFGTPVYSEKQRELDNHLTTLQTAQNDPAALMKLAGADSTAPDWIKQQARSNAADLLTAERDNAKAQQIVATASESDLAKYLRSKKDDDMTTRVRGFLFSITGNKEMAQRMMDKLDKGTDKYVQGPDGKPYLLTVKANGEIVKGFNGTTGEALNDNDLVKVGAGIGTGKWQTTAEFFQDKAGNVYQTQHNDKGQIRTVNAKTGEVYSGGEKLERLRDTSKLNQMEQAQVYRRENFRTQLNQALQRATFDNRLKIFQQYNQALVGEGLPALSMGEMGLNPDGTLTGEATPGAGQQPAQSAQPVAPTNTQPQPATVAGPAVPGAITTAPTPGAPVTQPVAPSQRPTMSELEAQKKREAANIEVTKQEQEQFAKNTKTAVGEAAQGGMEVGYARRQQLDLIKRNPSILNIMNGDGTQFDQARNIITRIASGAYSDDNKEALYKDIKATGMGQNEQAALIDFANLNTGINAKTLKLNSGAGSISNAEQQANKDANIGNIDRIPAYAALSGLYRSQFTADLNASKQNFLNAHPEFKTDAQFNSAWQKEESNLLKGYQGIAKARFDVIGKPPAADAGKEAIAAYKDRVFRAFEAYPAPQYDTNTGTWNYQTANAKRAAMKQILGQ